MTDGTPGDGAPDDEIADLVDSIEALDDGGSSGSAPDGQTRTEDTTGNSSTSRADADGTLTEDDIPADADVEDVEELLDQLDDETVDEIKDDAISTDPRAESFGTYAGLAVSVLLGLMLFVGPWRFFDLALGGDIPFAVRESTEMNILFVAPLPIALVGFATGGIYRATTEDLAEEYKSDIVAQVIVVQALVAAALFGLFMLIPVGSALLDGAVVTAILAVVLAVVYLLFFTFFEFLAMAIYVGIPAFVGVAAGGLLAGLLE